MAKTFAGNGDTPVCGVNRQLPPSVRTVPRTGPTREPLRRTAEVASRAPTRLQTIAPAQYADCRRLTAYVEPCVCENWRGSVVRHRTCRVRRNTRTEATRLSGRLRVSDVHRRPACRSGRWRNRFDVSGRHDVA